MVAIVTDHDDAVLRRIAALRQPDGTGLLILLDSATFGPSRGGAPAGRAEALAGLVAQAGWSTCVVSSGMTVAQAWEAISVRSPVTFGAGQ